MPKDPQTPDVDEEVAEAPVENSEPELPEQAWTHDPDEIGALAPDDLEELVLAAEENDELAEQGRIAAALLQGHRDADQDKEAIA